jgi:hypothetical protein
MRASSSATVRILVLFRWWLLMDRIRAVFRVCFFAVLPIVCGGTVVSAQTNPGDAAQAQAVPAAPDPNGTASEPLHAAGLGASSAVVDAAPASESTGDFGPDPAQSSGQNSGQVSSEGLGSSKAGQRGGLDALHDGGSSGGGGLHARMHRGAGFDFGSGFGSGGRGGMNGRSLDLDSLFRMTDRLSQDIAKGASVDRNSAMGNVLGTIPKLDQMERNGLKLPVDSSLGKFQFSYRDVLGQGGNAMGGEIGRGSAQAAFQSKGLKDDMFHFSATAMYDGPGGGGRSSFLGSEMSGGSAGGGAGSPFSGGMNGAGIGSGSGSGGFAGGGSMHGAMGGESGGMHAGNSGSRHGEPGPSVSLKLSF